MPDDLAATYPRVIAVMTREGFTSVITEISKNGPVHFVADADIDDDGSGPSHGDPYHQDDTTLHLDGRPLNADEDLYVVVPPVIPLSVKGVVLGCKCTVTNRRNGQRSLAVIGDIGPRTKDGEISVALAIALGINPNPNTGGEDSAVIEYLLEPNIPAVVNGKQYQLQPYHG